MTTNALFRRTGGEDFPEWIKAMLTGPPKSGKTSMLGTVPNIVIADTEPHANNLQSVAHLNLPYVTINAMDDLHKLLFVLRDPTMRQKAAEGLGMEKIEAVGIDTLDTLQDIMKKERLREMKQSQMQRDDWAWIKDQMEQIILAFNSLPLHVFFLVHTKTKEIGKGDDARTTVLPGLDGAIAESIAGMVGYSLLSFRKQEVRPDGSPYTAYFIRTEGDQTYDYLGNRAAGKLPDIINPDFKTLHDVVKASKAAVKNVAQSTQPQQVQAPVQTPPPVDPTQVIGTTAPDGSAPPETPGNVAQLGQTAQPNPTQPTASSAPPATPEAEQSAPATPTAQPQEAAQNSGQPGLPTDAAEKVNAAALTHVKRVYDAAGVEFPEDVIRDLTMDEARQLVKMWNAINQDALEGKGTPGVSPPQEMKQFLVAMGWLTNADMVSASTEPDSAEDAPTPEVEAVPESLAQATTIKKVIAWVGDDLGRAQEAYDAELAKGDGQRSSLVNALVNQGVKVQTPVQNNTAGQSPDVAATGVTPEQPTADEAPTEDEAVATVEGTLGGEVAGVEVDESKVPCEECGGEIDDLDIARLSKARFQRWLDVEHYIAETKKPR